MFTLVIAFVSGIALGVVAMAFASAKSLDNSSEEVDRLKELVDEKEQQLKMYDEFVHSLQYSYSLHERERKTEEFTHQKNSLSLNDPSTHLILL